LLIVLAVTAALGGAAETEEVLKAGEQGNITLNVTAVAGDLILRPGNYRVQHRADGGEHFMRFTRVGWTRQPPQKTPPRRVTVIEAEVNCDVEPLNHEVTDTTFYVRTEDGATRLTRIERPVPAGAGIHSHTTGPGTRRGQCRT
jgi:hypothetical protein